MNLRETLKRLDDWHERSMMQTRWYPMVVASAWIAIIATVIKVLT